MQKEYDFSGAVKNPYVGKIKKQITINIDSDSIEYFKSLSKNCGIPYQALINLYLADCAKQKKELHLLWE